MKNQFLFILKNYVTKEQLVEIQHTLNELNKSNANKLVESKAIQVIIVQNHSNQYYDPNYIPCAQNNTENITVSFLSNPHFHTIVTKLVEGDLEGLREFHASYPAFFSKLNEIFVDATLD